MEKGSGRKSTRHIVNPEMAFSDVVPNGNRICEENTLVQEKTRKPVPSETVIDYDKLNRHSPRSMPLLDQNLRAQGFSKSDIKFTRQAWRPNTKKTYSNYLKQWIQFCKHFKIDPAQPDLSQVAKFLILLSKQGSAYSTVNIARCTISAVTHVDNYNTIGANRYISMVVAAAGNANPPEPRYSSTWNVKDVLNIFKRWGRNTRLPIRLLTWKLTVLSLLCTAQRGQTIWLLPLSGLVCTEE